MKKTLFLLLILGLGLPLLAQTKIQLRSTDQATCVKSDYSSLKASFSFSGLEATEMQSERGAFSMVTLPNTVMGGNEGDPQIPVVNELIAVPLGANPTITVTSFTSTDYRLEDYGIHRLMPRQPSLRKDQRPEEVPFVYNEAAYQTRGLRSEPKAFVSVEGTMRGIQLGKMTIEPVSYDPMGNTLRVFNNIEVEVRFEGADAAATQQLLLDTYSPYFDIVYAQLFNGRAVLDAYTDHPDLYTTPVKMMVITTSTYANSTAFQNWVTWKKQKGIYVDVFTTNQTGSTASAIKSFIQTQYNQNHPTFLVIVGDTGDVTYSLSSSTTSKVTDLYYSSPDGDLFPDIFTSRMPVSSVTELGNLVNKILTYEKYTMADPSYLSKVLLIAGSDATWNPRVGQPTINYAADNYFNTAHGFTNVYKYLTSYTNCYTNLNTGVGFANYTAHGGETGWSGPSFSVSDANSLTNTDKYFWAMGNCCLAANWGYSGTCLAEALLRGANKGAFGYIGSCPETYWWEDYYFGVGATTTINNTPAMSNTKTGSYDGMFMDDMYNTLNSVPFLGNVAVTYAHAGSYSYSVTDTYYWEAYHCLGDGSVMPYHVNPSPNQVSHAPTLGIGLSTFTVNALPGSYVALTKDNEILGAAQVGTSGTVDVPITPVTSDGEVMIVVTRQQRQPYITTIPIVALEGPYIALDNYTPTTALIGESTPLSLTFKNVGVDASVGTTSITLTADNPNVQINGTGSFGALAPDATVTVNGFSFSFSAGIALGTGVTFHYTAVNGSNTWEGIFTISPDQIFTVTVAVNNANYGSASGGGEYHYGQSCTVTATPNEGYLFTGWTVNGQMVSSAASYTFNVNDDLDLIGNLAIGITIGDGGTATNSYLPSYNYYDNTLSEQIYTAQELGEAGTLTAIAFYNGGAEKTRTYDFYLKATNKNTFSSTTDWVSVASSNKVFSGSVTMTANAWTYITFDTPFEYDGTSNLVLVANDHTGSWSNSPHMTCRVFTTSGNQALYKYRDNTSFNPSNPSNITGTLLNKKNQIIFAKAIDDTPNTETQTLTLAPGWNWFSCFLAFDNDLVEALLEAIAETNSTAIIKNMTSNATLENGTWSNTLSFENETMFMICLENPVTLELTATPANPAEHPIILAPGWNWIPFLGNETMSMQEALSGLNPNEGDVIKSSSQNATYANGQGWNGSLNTLAPSMGYMYLNNGTTSLTLTYPTVRRK